jgi:hypothetical protein
LKSHLPQLRLPLKDALLGTPVIVGTSFMEQELSLFERLYHGPALTFWWTRVIDVTNWLAVIFAFRDKRAHWMLTAWLTYIIIILALYDNYGFVRILGLAHMIAWTPLVIYLWRQRKPFGQETFTGKYLYVAMAVLGTSLIFDYIDVAKYFLGFPEY